MKPPRKWLIILLCWGGWVIALAALMTLAYAVWRYYQVNFMEWPCEVQWAVAGALALLLAGSRMRFIASRLQARAMVTEKPEVLPEGQSLNPRLQVYEERRREVLEPDFALQLRKLHELKEAGIITDAEFEQKKSAILEKI